MFVGKGLEHDIPHRSRHSNLWINHTKLSYITVVYVNYKERNHSMIICARPYITHTCNTITTNNNGKQDKKISS